MRLPIAGFLLASAIAGCGGSGLSDAELREFQTLEVEVIAACARAEPGEGSTGALTGRLDRMLALMSEDPDLWYDSDPTNSPGIEDETTPALSLVYIGGLLGGREGPPPCSRAEATRVDAATDAVFE